MRKNSFPFIVVLLVLMGSFAFSQQAAAAGLSSLDQKKLEKIHTMYRSYKERAFSMAPDVTVEELLQWQKQDSVILVDVRSPKASMQAVENPGLSEAAHTIQDKLESVIKRL